MQITGGDTIDHVGTLQRPFVSGLTVRATVKNTVTDEIVLTDALQEVFNDAGNIGIRLAIPTTGWKYHQHEMELKLINPSGVIKTSDNNLKIDVKRPMAAVCVV